jgi:hypothetical protein
MIHAARVVAWIVIARTQKRHLHELNHYGISITRSKVLQDICPSLCTLRCCMLTKISCMQNDLMCVECRARSSSHCYCCVPTYRRNKGLSEPSSLPDPASSRCLATKWSVTWSVTWSVASRGLRTNQQTGQWVGNNKLVYPG